MYEELVTPDEIDESFVPRPVKDVDAVVVGDEVVIVDGWKAAAALNSTSALLWSHFDGRTPLRGIIDDLSRSHEVDREVVSAQALSVARHLGADGFLEGVGPPTGLLQIVAEPEIGVGDLIDDVFLTDLDGVEQRLSDHRGREVLLVNWNPHCGYCATIADRLAELHGALTAAGIDLVLLASGGADANRAVAEASGLQAPILLLPPGALGPFRGHGTPSAYHLDGECHLVSPMASGCIEVRALAEQLAGSGSTTRFVDETAPEGIRYILDADGACAPFDDGGSMSSWAGTRVYRIGDFHIGLRFDQESTATILDALFHGSTVEDPRAGHSHSVVLAPLVGPIDSAWV